ncbi:MAG: two-component regulator propeller domain-containing protein, partial [Candidatus Latescibacterota bacterium]
MHILARPALACLQALLAACVLAASPARGHSGQVCLARAVQGITVDGSLQDWPADLDRYPILLTEYGSRPASAADFQADFRVGYGAAEKALYLALRVQDESAQVDTSVGANWDTGDGCEVYLQMGHQDEGVPIAQFAVYGTRMRIGSPQWARWAAAHGDGGHVYEWRLDVSRLVPEGAAASAMSLGVDVVAIDSDADGSYSWMAWSRGLRKIESAARLGDLVVLPEPVDTGRISGTVRRAGTSRTVARQRVRIHSLDSPDLSVTAETADDGTFGAVLPVGRYAVMTQGTEGSQTVQVVAGSGAQALLTVPVPEGRAVPAGPGRLVRQVQGIRFQAWHHFGAADGLPTSANALCQTRDGYVWIGTLGGLCRYDGRDLLVFATADGLPAPQVQALAEGEDGALWIGTPAGLCRYDGRHFVTFTTAHGMAADRVRALVPDGGGGLWVGTEGGLCRYAEHHFASFTRETGLPNNLITSLHVGRDGSLWVGTEGG